MDATLNTVFQFFTFCGTSLKKFTNRSIKKGSYFVLVFANKVSSTKESSIQEATEFDIIIFVDTEYEKCTTLLPTEKQSPFFFLVHSVS